MRGIAVKFEKDFVNYTDCDFFKGRYLEKTTLRVGLELTPPVWESRAPAGWCAYNTSVLTHLNNNTTFKGSKVNTSPISHITEKTFDAYLRGNKIKNNIN